MSMWQRVVLWIVAGLLGAVFGAAGAISRGGMWAGIPVGVIVASVGLAALLVAFRVLSASRVPPIFAGVGAIIATLMFSQPGASGALVTPAGDADMISGINLGWLWLGIVIALTIAIPLLPVRNQQPVERDLDLTP